VGVDEPCGDRKIEPGRERERERDPWIAVAAAGVRLGTPPFGWFGGLALRGKALHGKKALCQRVLDAWILAGRVRWGLLGPAAVELSKVDWRWRLQAPGIAQGTGRPMSRWYHRKSENGGPRGSN
jgi:hypothetical protein